MSKPYVFSLNGTAFAFQHGAIYYWHGTHVSNMPYASKRVNGWEPYVKTQNELTNEELVTFERIKKENENE